MAHFSDQVHITISSFTQNVIYYDLKLSQKMAEEVFLNSTEKSINVRGAKNINSHSGENTTNS